MWEKFRAIFTIPELRQKIFFTLILLAVFRIGYQIPLPVVDQHQIAENLKLQGEGTDILRFMQTVSTFSAADLRRITIFGLGIMPYISASIILQLLGSVYKPLEDLRKEGERSIVMFKHEGWKEPVEFMHHCSTKWAVFLMSLKSLVENGRGAPSPNDVKVDNDVD